ncbi:MAG: CpaD family pilus assembly lipoprotein [Alphaproteobacteria bacterium]
MRKTTNLVKVIALVAASLTAACTAQSEGRLENRHQTRVDLARFQTPVETEAETGMPTSEGYSEAAAFLVSLHAGYGDIVMVRGGSPEGRRSLVEGLRGYYRSLDFVTLPGGTGSLVVTVERAVATPPPCGDWSAPSGHDTSNSGGLDLGCSTEGSLGLMVADPRDLQGGAPPGPESSTVGVRGIAEMNAGPLVITPQTEVTDTTE